MNYLLEFVPLPPEIGMVPLDMVKGQKLVFRPYTGGLLGIFRVLAGTMGDGFYYARIHTQAAFGAFSHIGCHVLAVHQFKNICEIVIPGFIQAHARAMTYFDGNAVCLVFHSGHWFLPRIMI